MTAPKNKHFIVGIPPDWGYTVDPQHVTETTTEKAVNAALERWIDQYFEFTAEDIEGMEIWVAEAKNFTIHTVEVSARWKIDKGRKAE